MFARRILGILASVGLLLAGLTGIQPATAATAIEIGDIYNPTAIVHVYLDVPADSAATLNNAKTLKTWVAASVHFELDGKTSQTMQIGMRLKGSTSIQPLNQKPSMKLKFNWSKLAGQRFLGLKNMTLNSMTQDGSMIHEAATYKLYNAMGLVAPRTGWAEVFVNGSSKGLYVNIETPDDVFLASKFTDQTQHLYEGVAWNDLAVGKDNGGENDGAFLVDEGWSKYPNKGDLTKLISVANQANLKTWWAQLGTYMDRDRLIGQFAVENILGSWDAYSGDIINNYFLRSNTAGKFTMMPWGVDQNFGENRETPVAFDDYFFPMDTARSAFPWIKYVNKNADDLPRGILFQKCLKYSVCKTLYLQKLKAVSAKASAIKYVPYMTQLAATIASYSGPAAKAEQVRTIAWFKTQQANVGALLKKYKIK
jgi:spore coat protein CotH